MSKGCGDFPGGSDKECFPAAGRIEVGLAEDLPFRKLVKDGDAGGLGDPWGPLLGGLLRSQAWLRARSAQGSRGCEEGGMSTEALGRGWGCLRGRAPGPLSLHRDELRAFLYPIFGLPLSWKT